MFEQTQEDSLTDPLTGLPNTRFMFMHLTRELARAERLKAEVALLVMDLDNFKEINDNHGHHVGDRALREVASVLRSGIRPYDICVRYAGDEFIVVLSGCGADEAERKRAELQQTVDEVLFEARPGRRLPLAISVGAAIYPQDGDSYEALLATADSRMYRDKTRRKQRVQVQPAATGTDGLPAVSVPLQHRRRKSPRSKSSAPASECFRSTGSGLGSSILLDQNLIVAARRAASAGDRVSFTSCGGPQTRHVLSGEGSASASKRFADAAPPSLPVRFLFARDGEVGRILPAVSRAASSGRNANSSTERAL